MTSQIETGTTVSHPAHGVGRVLFGKDGFPKVKVQFPTGILKVAREELIFVAGPSAPARRSPTSRPRRVAQHASPAATHDARPLIERVADLLESWRAELGGMPAQTDWRKGLHYDPAEVELIFLVAKSLENSEELGRLLGRSAHAIDLVWRWCDGANFPDRSQNEIARQVEDFRQRLGDAARGSWARVPGELMRFARGRQAV